MYGWNVRYLKVPRVIKQGTTSSMLTLPSGRNENLKLAQVVYVLDKGRMDTHSAWSRK